VALKTEGVHVLFKSLRITLISVASNEKLGQAAGMGLMTIGALAIGQGRVKNRCHFVGDIMALLAQSRHLVKEKSPYTRGMRTVAIGTASIRDRFMYKRSCHHVIVALLAQFS